LTFGIGFNKLINLDNNVNLTDLTFATDFNKPIDLKNNVNLVNLTFGKNFRKHIDLSNNTKLNYLAIGLFFNGTSSTISCKFIALDCIDSKITDNLHNGIEK